MSSDLIAVKLIFGPMMPFVYEIIIIGFLFVGHLVVVSRLAQGCQTGLGFALVFRGEGWIIHGGQRAIAHVDSSELDRVFV